VVSSSTQLNENEEFLCVGDYLGHVGSLGWVGDSFGSGPAFGELEHSGTREVGKDGGSGLRCASGGVNIALTEGVAPPSVVDGMRTMKLNDARGEWWKDALEPVCERGVYPLR